MGIQRKSGLLRDSEVGEYEHLLLTRTPGTHRIPPQCLADWRTAEHPIADPTRLLIGERQGESNSAVCPISIQPAHTQCEKPNAQGGCYGIVRQQLIGDKFPGSPVSTSLSAPAGCTQPVSISREAFALAILLNIHICQHLPASLSVCQH